MILLSLSFSSLLLTTMILFSSFISSILTILGVSSSSTVIIIVSFSSSTVTIIVSFSSSTVTDWLLTTISSSILLSISISLSTFTFIVWSICSSTNFIYDFNANKVFGSIGDKIFDLSDETSLCLLFSLYLCFFALIFCFCFDSSLLFSLFYKTIIINN